MYENHFQQGYVIWRQVSRALSPHDTSTRIQLDVDGIGTHVIICAFFGIKGLFILSRHTLPGILCTIVTWDMEYILEIFVRSVFSQRILYK
jgi:hypothetical protein